MKEFIVNNPKLTFALCVLVCTLISSILSRLMKLESKKARLICIGIGIGTGALIGGLLIY